MICGRKHGPTLQYKSVLHYSVHLRKQTYSLTEPVPLNCGKLAAKYPRIYGYYVYTALHGELKWDVFDVVCRSGLLGSRQPGLVPVQSRTPSVSRRRRSTSSPLRSTPVAVQHRTTQGNFTAAGSDVGLSPLQVQGTAWNLLYPTIFAIHLSAPVSWDQHWRHSSSS